MKLILVGPPGAGKGTQSSLLASHFSIPHISTGDIFRANIKGQTELGKLAQSYTSAGNLVPDSVTNDMVADRLKQDDLANGYLLDGYPRNVGQAEFLSNFLNQHQEKLDAVLEFSLSNEEIITRLSGRRVCKNCQAPFHIEFERPKVTGVCDKCGGELYQRDDDKEEVIANRLEVYNDQTAPIINYYKNTGLLKTISALGSVEEIFQRALIAIK